MASYQIIELDCGQGNPGESRTNTIGTFTTLDRALGWLEMRGHTKLNNGAYFTREYKPGESRMGERLYYIKPIDLDPT